MPDNIHVQESLPDDSKGRDKEITTVSGGPGKEKPDHKMGLWGAISFVCGSVIGSGVFISPSTILKETQSVGLSLSIWVLSAVVSAIGAWCYIEMGTSVRKSGSDFIYAHYLKLYPLAFSFGITTCFITHTSTLAIQALTFAEYLKQGVGLYAKDEHTAHLYNVLISFGIISLISMLNFYSIRTVVSRFQIVASFAKICSTMLIICVGGYYLFFKGQSENLQRPFENSRFSAGSLVSAFFAGLLAFDGWDVLNMGIEEMRDPRRDMPLATGIGLSLVTVIFVLTNIAYSVVLSVPEIQGSNAIVVTFADKSMGRFGSVVPFVICIVLIGSLNSTLFIGSRALHAISKRGFLPPFLSCLSHRRGSPRVAIIVHILGAMCMASSFDIHQLINYKGCSSWSQRTVTILLLIYIRLSNTPVDPQRIRTPIFIPFIFISCTSALVITTVVGQTRTALVVMGALSIGFMIYFIFIWERALPRFEAYNRLKQRINVNLNKICEYAFRGQIDTQKDQGAKKTSRVGDSSTRDGTPSKRLTTEQLPSTHRVG